MAWADLPYFRVHRAGVDRSGRWRRDFGGSTVEIPHRLGEEFLAATRGTEIVRAARLFGMQDNAGVTGGTRPGPTAVEGQVPATPGISQVLPDAVLPAPAAGDDSKRRKKRRTAKNDTGAAAPGFSIQ